MPKSILSPYATYLEIKKPGDFQRFYLGLILRENLSILNLDICNKWML